MKIATTRLMPLHSGKGRTVAEALGRVTDYVENPEKTNGGDLVSAYQCKAKMIELLTAKNNVDRILGVTEKEKNRDRQQEAR